MPFLIFQASCQFQTGLEERVDFICAVLTDMYEDVKEYLNWYDTRKDMSFAPDAPVIGLVLQRSHLVTGDEGHYSGVVSEMESLGAKVGIASHAMGIDML